MILQLILVVILLLSYRFPYANGNNDYDIILCEFAAATNIGSILRSWRCTNGLPATNICKDSTTSSWTGVVCSSNGIEGMNIQRLHISGTIPSSLGLLTSLTYLSLFSNSLHGVIPSSFGNLINLKSLLLYQNSFSGSIPSQLCNLPLDITLFYQNNLICYPSCLSTVTVLDTGDAKLCPEPTPYPTPFPTPYPTPYPTLKPTPYPTIIPTSHPTIIPTSYPTIIPTSYPTIIPTSYPTFTSTPFQSPTPSITPSSSPTSEPTTSIINFICGTVDEMRGTVTLIAPSGSTLGAIEFASYGTPSGVCGNFTKGVCDATSSVSVITKLCTEKISCTLSASNKLFGDPCFGKKKSLNVQIAIV
eukprot:gene4177-8301_t